MLHLTRPLAAILVLCCTLPWSAAATAAQPHNGGPFVFAYFNTGGKGQAQGLQLAYSRDGYKWTKIDLPGDSFLTPAVGGKLLRDPSIVQGPDGVFHMVWTTDWWKHGIGVAHSKDLIHWSEQKYLDVMKDFPGYVNCWAPEITYDAKSQTYLIYWASTVPGKFPETEGKGETFRGLVEGVKAAHRMYVTTTKDFESYTPTRLFYDDGYNCIDAFIVYDRPRDRWVMVIKDEELLPEPKKDIRVAFAQDPLGPWSKSSEPISPHWVEGPALLRVGNRWLLYFDAYTRNRFEGLATEDFESWTPITDRLELPDGIRHGTPFAVSEAVLDGLLHAAPKPPLEPVRLQSIKLGGFWRQQARRLTERWLPHCIRQMEEGGRGQELLNLKAAACVLRNEPPDWKYTGAPWSDAYVYNTVEAACLALAVDPTGDAELAKAQKYLRDKLEEWIPIILAAQAKDGYVHSFHVVNGHPRYSNINWHELYVMGYFVEMGVAHCRMSGGKDRRLYDAAVRCADQLCDTFGPLPKRTWKNGHPGLEYALCRLGRLVDEVEGAGEGDKYVQLARYFLDHQHEGDGPSEYNQSDVPAVEMSEAKGHAVRATYFYTAMTDMALLQQSQAYRQAVDRIWASAIQRKHYLTGGVGASHKGEAFDADYRLPNNGYCESCAGCGLSFWADRMHRLHGDAHYRDVQERVLLNNILGAVSLDGENFFYQNPLDSDKARYPWHGCPCCVGNIPRALLAIKDLIYSTNHSRDELYLSHFVDSEAEIDDVGGTQLRIRQETEYPWQGDVTVTLHPTRPHEFALKIRIPDRTESDLYTAEPKLPETFSVSVNGEPQSFDIEHGYATLRRTWKDGDRVEITLPMEVQRVRCDDRVVANRGRVAIQRGPLVYNVEDVDHSEPVESLVLSPQLPLAAVWKKDLLGGVTAIEGRGITAVPNFVRLNRGGRSLVWIVEDPEEAEKYRTKPPQDLPGFAAIESRTIDVVAIGDATSEKQHRLAGKNTGDGEAFGHHWRHAVAGGWFSYRLKVSSQGPNAVFCTYWGSDSGNRRFTIQVDDTPIGRQTLDSNRPQQFFGVEYVIPEELTAGNDEVTVKLQAEPGALAGGIFDLRTFLAK